MLVKSLRHEKNWSQDQLAKISGLNIRTIQRVEKGEKVGLETYKSLAAVFEVDVSELRDNNTTEIDLGGFQANGESLTDLEKVKDEAEAYVKSKKEFYMQSLFLFGIFIFILLTNYNQPEYLEAIIVFGVSFAIIIINQAVIVFKPLVEAWEMGDVKRTMDILRENKVIENKESK